MFIALLSVADAGSSSMLSDAGSNGMSEPKLMSNCDAGCCCCCCCDDGCDNELVLAPGVEKKPLDGCDDCWNAVEAAEFGFGTENVKAACFNAMFSDCNRDRRSLRLPFSDSACWFFASRAATLSSN